MIEIRMCYIQPKPAGKEVRNSYVIEVATADVDGMRYETRSRSSGEAALARKLVEVGVPDQPWTSFTPTGTPALRGKSIHRLAQMTVVESDRRGLQAVRFQVHPLSSTASSAVPDFEGVVE